MYCKKTGVLYSACTACHCLCPTSGCGTWANVSIFLNMLFVPTITLLHNCGWSQCLLYRRACPITNVCAGLPVKHAHVGYVCHVYVSIQTVLTCCHIIWICGFQLISIIQHAFQCMLKITNTHRPRHETVAQCTGCMTTLSAVIKLPLPH